MADATTTTAAPEVKIDDVGPAMKRLTITIAPDTIKEKIEESIGTLSNEAALPGFRRGKVPRRLLEKRFGTTVKDETRSRLVADAYARAIQEHGIHPVGEPEPTEPPEKLRIEEGKPLTFSVDVEVVPDFELPDLEGIELVKPQLEITDKHIDDRLKLQALRLGTTTDIDDGFVEGDRMLAHVVVTKEGQEEPLHVEDQAVIVVPGKADGGQGPVLGVMVEGLAASLSGKRVGETLTLHATGPEAYEREDVRGAKLTFALRITAAQRAEPATNEQMVEIFDAGSVENLREQMRLALQHRRDQEQATALRGQVHTYLLEHADLQLPEKLSATQAARALEGHRLELLERGLPAAEVEAKLAEIRGQSEQESRDQLKLFFLLHRLATHYDINVTEQEVNGRVAAIAMEHGQRPDQLRAELSRTGRLAEVTRLVRDQKAADRVVAVAKIKEVTAEEWNKQATASAKKTPTKKKTKKAPGTKKKTTKKTKK